MNRLIVFLSLIVLAFCGSTNASASNNSESVSGTYEVIRADFGLFNPPESGEPLFLTSKVVPFTLNQGYGWVILLRTNKPTIKWREEFTLPAKPISWGEPEELGSRRVSDDGRTSITEREVYPDQGIIFNSWAVADGDPKGQYVIRVFIEGSLASEFTFEVQ